MNENTAEPLSDILNSLLKDPKISEIMSSLSKGDAKDGDKSPSLTVPTELISKLPQLMGGIQSLGSVSKGNSDHRDPNSQRDRDRRALLSALRPFLSEKRRSMIDALIQLWGVTGVISTIKNTESNGG